MPPTSLEDSTLAAVITAIASHVMGISTHEHDECNNQQHSTDELNVPSPGRHAHFDCFSGAAGDMLLAACLDAAPDPQMLLQQVKDGLLTMNEIRDEFDLHMERVVRGSGCIAANKVHVSSIYQHRAAPVPSLSSSGADGDAQDHSHFHCHSHDDHHGHTHNHGE